MEVVEGARRATLYLPTASGLAAVTPTLIGLSYAAEYFGEGVALGGPVAWAGEVWLPVLGKKGVVNLVGKPGGAAKPVVLPTSAPAPKDGFDAPVFDPLHVIWPSEEGQLIVRLDQKGNKETDWIAWPAEAEAGVLVGLPLSVAFRIIFAAVLERPERVARVRANGQAGPREGCHRCAANRHRAHQLQESATDRGRPLEGAPTCLRWGVFRGRCAAYRIGG